METMSRLRASFRSSTRRKKKKKSSPEESEDDDDSSSSLGVYLQEIELELRPKESFRPSELRVLFSVPESPEILSSCPSPWEPGLKSSLQGVSVWVPPFELRVPLSETQDAFFLLEDVRKKKRRKALAKARISLKEFALNPPLKLKLRPLSRKILSASINLSLEKPNSFKEGLSTHKHQPHHQHLEVPLPPIESLSLTTQEEYDDGEIEYSSAQLSHKSDLRCDAYPSSMENIPDLPPKEEEEGYNNPEQPPLQALPTQKETNEFSSRAPSTQRKTEDLASREPSFKAPPISTPPPPPLPSSRIPIFPERTSLEQEELETDLSDLILIPQNLLSVSANSQRELSSPSHTPIPSNGSSDETLLLLEWAKDVLHPSKRIKITNLTSSWRNGIGYCALLHTKFPELVPLGTLENHNQESNRKLASDLVESLGGGPLGGFAKEDVTEFLKEIKRILDGGSIIKFNDEEVEKWRGMWFPQDEESGSPSPSGGAGVSSSIVEEPSSPERSSSHSNRNERAKRLIQEAHSSYLPPPAVTLREKTLPTSPEIRQSVILLKKELLSLAEEEERIKAEKNELESQLRSEGSVPSKKLSRWIELVNERNSLVRRQMQLNIKEKESVINGRLESLRERLRGFEEISESLKTEEMRNEEAALIEELVSTVNEKNELVHHLDNEEKAIDEDERIKSMLEEQKLHLRPGKGLKSIKDLKVVGSEECALM